MGNFTESVNFITSVGAIIGQIILLMFLISWLWSYLSDNKGTSLASVAITKYSRWIIPANFAVVAISVTASLIYSEVIGFPPCELCWMQRVFMYPQLIIFGLALWKKTRDSAIYCLPLSVVGTIIAGYHFYGQSFNPDALPACDITIGATSCAVKYFVEFGYITLPLMSLISFLLLILGTTLAISSEKKSAAN